MILKVIVTLKKLFYTFGYNLYHFGFYVSFYKTIDIFTYHFPQSYIFTFVNDKKHKSIKKYLLKKYGQFINSYLCISTDYIVKEVNQQYGNKNIWLCWWQGENDLDGITKICVNSIRVNAVDCNVIFITMENYTKYIEMPDFIIKKKEKGIISLTEFSDILRINLLNKYGGIWIDVTVLVTSILPHSYFEYEFFSCKEKALSNVFVSDYRWATHFMGGKRGHIIFDFVSKMFFEYWEKEEALIDYFLFDYLIDIGYDLFEPIRKAIDKVPFNNPKKGEMVNNLNNFYDEKVYEKLTEDTLVFKLSRKTNYNDLTANSKITFYKYFSDKFSN
ncbi:MAG: capsular polysaccharide synthesis protein [Bacteroidia bacterium]